MSRKATAVLLPGLWLTHYSKYGYCKDSLCDEPDEEDNLTLDHGVYVCDGCLEGRRDEEAFRAANEMDMREIA